MKILSFLDKLDLSKGMKIALVASVVFHLSVMIIGVIGLPYIKKPTPLPPQTISVDIVDISEMTTTNKKPNEVKKKPKDEAPPKVKKKVKAPPKVEAKEPPKVKPLEKPPEPPKEDVKPPEPETPPPPSEKLAEAKPEPKPEKKEPKEDKKEEQTISEEDFLSVLKNLQDEEPTGEINPEGDEQTSPEESPLAQFADRLSATEADMIARRLNVQFASCWNLMAGARNAEDITVSINLQVRPDRTVQSARIVDQWRYSQDSFYRAAADTALRAIKHPNCETLDLPEDKYNLWKDLTFNFNPAVQL